MKFYIETLGCKVNTYETGVIKSNFIKENYLEANTLEEADIIIINTCSVTNQSDAKSRKVIRNAKRRNKDAILVVCGCSSQNHQENLSSLDIDILIGNKDKTQITRLVKEYLENKEKITSFYDMQNVPFENMIIDNYEDRTRAFIKIQDGCNNYCTYCIIPYLRGNIRHKKFEDVITEVNNLTEKGFKEIVLTGIHTGSYPDFTKLVHEISKNNKLERIRISSIEITELDDAFLEELKYNPKICNHLHVPIQSGSDNVLKMMNRKYNINEYKNKIEKIRNIRPDINITTDLIVGFPTESSEDFIETINNINDIKFGKIHVFPFSKRDKTAAAKMKNIVSDIEKKNRTHMMLEISDKLENEYYNKFIGQKLNVLIEEKDGEYSIGHTSNYIKVYVKGELLHNENYNILIDRVEKTKVYGILL